MTTHQLIHQSNSNEWGSPKPVVESARLAMGSIDLDPASSAIFNETVKATRYLTKEHNGLMYKWRGNIWLNPPYGKVNWTSNQEIWSTMLVKQFALGYVTRAVLLVNAQTGDKWFHKLWEYNICFVYRRLKFIDEWGYENPQPTHGNVLVGFGIPLPVFRTHFSRFGEIVPARAIRSELFMSATGLEDVE